MATAFCRSGLETTASSLPLIDAARTSATSGTRPLPASGLREHRLADRALRAFARRPHTASTTKTGSKSASELSVKPTLAEDASLQMTPPSIWHSSFLRVVLPSTVSRRVVVRRERFFTHEVTLRSLRLARRPTHPIRAAAFDLGNHFSHHGAATAARRAYEVPLRLPSAC
jgi:hypothetical protein